MATVVEASIVPASIVPAAIHVGVASSASPITVEHQRQVATAKTQSKKIYAAAKVAGFNGWMTGFFAACSLPFAFFSVTDAVVAAGLSAIAYNEFRGRRMLLAFDRRGPGILGWNQIGFLSLIAGYCLWMTYQGLTSPSPFDAELKANPQLSEVLGSIDEINHLHHLAIVAIYGATILFSAIFQGLNAVYYFTRRRLVDTFVRETPSWVVELLRSC